MSRCFTAGENAGPSCGELFVWVVYLKPNAKRATILGRMLISQYPSWMETSKARGAPPLCGYAPAPWHHYKARLPARLHVCARPPASADVWKSWWGERGRGRRARTATWATGCLRGRVRSFGSRQRGTNCNYPSVSGGHVKHAIIRDHCCDVCIPSETKQDAASNGADFGLPPPHNCVHIPKDGIPWKAFQSVCTN